MHVMNGICFRCWGAGHEPYTAKKLEAWLKRARQEYRKRSQELKTATGKRKAVLAKELRLLESMGKKAKAQLEKKKARRATGQLAFGL